MDHLEPGYDCPALPGWREDQVLTPALLVDLDALEANLARMAAAARAAGVALRPTTEETLAQDAHWLEIGRRIAASMNTRPGLAEAARRVVTLEAFHAALEREVRLGAEQEI